MLAKGTGIKNKNKELLGFLEVQLEQKVKQVENATKLYFQSLIVLAAGVATLVTALAALKGWEGAILTLFTFGIPAFLISWFGCFLFIYWEHHMLRINLDYAEKKASEALGIPDDEIYLYHEDYLGVFNQANFPFKWGPLKSVQAIFVIIGLPAFPVIYISIVKARAYFTENPIHWYIYLAIVSMAVITLLCIHLQCVGRERKLKRRLGIAPWDSRQQGGKK